MDEPGRWVALAVLAVVVGVTIAALVPEFTEDDDGPTPVASVTPSETGASPGASPEPTADPPLDLMSADLAGWQHHGPGSVIAEEVDGQMVYRTDGGMGVLWYDRIFGDHTVSFEVMVSDEADNSGVFLRIPSPPVDDTYTANAFEVQIDTAGQDLAATAGIYSIQGPFTPVVLEPGQWYRMVIVANGPQIRVSVDGVEVTSFIARRDGVITDFADRGYLGFQNHSDRDVVTFRRIRVTEP